MVEMNKTQNIERFFNELYGKKIDVRIYYIALKGINCNVKNNIICVNRTLNDIDQEMALVNGLNYVYQNNGFFATVKDEEYHELDARIVELLYSYYTFGDYGVKLLKDRLFKGYSIFNPKIKKCVEALQECKVKELLLSEIETAYSKYAR